MNARRRKKERMAAWSAGWDAALAAPAGATPLFVSDWVVVYDQCGEAWRDGFNAGLFAVAVMRDLMLLPTTVES